MKSKISITQNNTSIWNFHPPTLRLTSSRRRPASNSRNSPKATDLGAIHSLLKMPYKNCMLPIYVSIWTYGNLYEGQIYMSLNLHAFIGFYMKKYLFSFIWNYKFNFISFYMEYLYYAEFMSNAYRILFGNTYKEYILARSIRHCR